MSDNSSNGAVGFVMSLRDKLPDAMFPAAIPLKGDVCWQIAIGLVVLQEILWVLASGYFTCILMILVSLLRRTWMPRSRRLSPSPDRKSLRTMPR